MPDAELVVDLPGESWMRAVSTAHPAATFRVLAALPGEGVAVLELSAPDPVAVVARMEREPAVTSLDVLHAGERVVLDVETDEPAALAPARRAGVAPRTPFEVRDGAATVRVTAPRDRLSALRDRLDAAGVAYDVGRVGATGTTGDVLTDRQREVLVAAAAEGYYETPRTATLTEVADALGVAKSTASDLLHRAEGSVVDWFLDRRPGATGGSGVTGGSGATDDVTDGSGAAGPGADT